MDLKQLFEKYNILLTDSQVKKFLKYMDILLTENEKYNLTSIKTEDEIFVKHFLDSSLPYSFFDKDKTVIDIGTGAGFPSIPLAIIRPDLHFTLIDSVEKKVNFVNMIVKELKLDNIVCYHGRCEDFAKKDEFREQFDYVVARAVAPLTSLIEYSVPFIKVNGLFIAYKGSSVNQEIENSQNAIKLLNIRKVNELKYNLDEINAVRYCIIFKKDKETPKKYPRSQNKVRLNPLQ